MGVSKPILERFWSKVQKTSNCWNWIGSQQGNGYGYLHNGTREKRNPLRAHRFSYEIHYGDIPSGLWVLHKCDNRLCVNPKHLFLGDRTDNMRDCAAKGRVCTIGKSNLTHCIRGHEFNETNTYVRPNGHRTCKVCNQIRARGDK